jgi:hypothetical protein
MKLHPLLLPALGILLCGTAQAIPQTVGALFAQNSPGNVPLEEWLRDANHWEPGVKLPGPWVAGTVSTGLMMSRPGAVFGIEATQVVVTRDVKGGIAHVQVFYDADTAKIAKSDLRKRLDKAVKLFTGADGKAAGYTVALAESNPGAVTATLKR